MPFSRYNGVFEPADLELLQRVFNQLCYERRLAQKDREQREDLATQIIREFNSGTTDEADLLQAFSRRHRRA
ncbi:hypothetical protein SAMN04488498_114100 [Mesorhizobium albiziae]|uniref:Uncharacterized protein n=1 Tax=Neomesorhizobium albiziae TaxID=335020 RepID=A0A1I4CUZ5_9HYPH|nr:hypothetical protein [Mesorhizobium albiziae]GLS31355.1 hypothetical protein GCM10007937_30650 [Mesorhizobium albiziae]SFK84440.1 hypothetical protein SAMN04488498_114100 [Mesorhizobium albiziae]